MAYETHETPELINSFSILALPLKYSRSDSSEGLVILTCTIPFNPYLFCSTNLVYIFCTLALLRSDLLTDKLNPAELHDFLNAGILIYIIDY